MREAKGNEFQQPPPCHIEIDQEKFEIVQHELREDEMELTIESLTGLTKYTNKGMYISFTTGVPSENPISCISTTSQGGPDFLFQFSNRLPLSRTRGTIKSFEIRKASFEVYRVRSLLRSPELIGKAFQPLVRVFITIVILCYSYRKFCYPILKSSPFYLSSMPIEERLVVS